LAKLPIIPERLLQIDELTVFEHHHIGLEDECFYVWERQSGATYLQSATNDFISNLQIPTSSYGTNRWYWKQQAIEHAARALGTLVPPSWKESSTFVPIPPSVVNDDPKYDARLITILKTVFPRLADCRELVRQKESTISKQKNISPEDRAGNYELCKRCFYPEPKHIVIFDDMLAGGSHFKAMKKVLAGGFPTVPISGLFLARAIRPDLCPVFDDLLV
jgi:hypothetical protein